MKALVAAFNQEKALVGAFSVIVQLHRSIDYSTSPPTFSGPGHGPRQLLGAAAGVTAEDALAGQQRGAGGQPGPAFAPGPVLGAQLPARGGVGGHLAMVVTISASNRLIGIKTLC